MPNLLINILQVNQSIGNVFWVSNVINRDLQIAAGTMEDRVDEIGQRRSVVCFVFFQP